MDKDINISASSIGSTYTSGLRKHNKVALLYPTSRKQSVCYESGYFVMLHMFNIVSCGVVDLWVQIFADSNPFHKDEVKNVQERCATVILELFEASVDSN